MPKIGSATKVRPEADLHEVPSVSSVESDMDRVRGEMDKTNNRILIAENPARVSSL